jgi:hypothetical protein
LRPEQANRSQDFISKITTARGRRPAMQAQSPEALSSNSKPTKKGKKEEEK